ncbi:aminopeptidase P family protein [Candidatus Saccharibacteria bacterium]|jgi:Xaa-Pro aminopeptidase|nr:MAG: aminopeptidase P family protein [Candidatus Saccharibacteria bacterium]
MKFSAKFFVANRQRLCKVLPGSAIVVAANGQLQRSADTPFVFRQDSNFWYLTGITEPDLILYIDQDAEEYIVLPDRDDHRNLWDGEVNTRSYEEVSGIKNYISSKQFSEKLEQLKLAKIKVARPSPPDPYLSTYGMFTNPARAILEKRLIKAGVKRVDCRMDLARLRSVKQKIELEAIQQAIDITIESLKSLKKKLSSQKSELELSNYLLAEFLKRGANGVAFESVIASAKNAATIHHRASDQSVKNDNLLLLDVGAEFSNYAADISRTWVIGEVSAKQVKCVAAVKEVQDFAFSLLRPGMYLRDYASQVRKFAADCYKQNRLIEHKQQIDEVLPHAISHFLGLDVHDAGDYERPLEENMVLTIEPGIYLPAERIGVRIEDDVLITKTGARWLSK